MGYYADRYIAANRGTGVYSTSFGDIALPIDAACFEQLMLHTLRTYDARAYKPRTFDDVWLCY